MSFEEKITAISSRIDSVSDRVATEEATKTSMILPVLSALGYDIFDPTVVVPEFTADIGKKKGEKVDYAIMRDGKPVILIEAKPVTEKLDRHKTQLERYFTVTDSKFAILTNGIEYRFYSDLEKPNVMDEAPFLVVDMTNLKSREIRQLEKFSSDALDIDSIVDMAGAKKYVAGIKEIFKEEAANPGDDMARFFASRLTNKTLRQNVLEEFKAHIKQAFSEVVSDMVNDKITALKNRLAEENAPAEEVAEGTQMQKDGGIVTTEEEMEGFYIVKSILAGTIPLDRVTHRDTKSYFGVLLDDNNRKWVVRLHFNSERVKYIGIHTADKVEERFDIETLDDIYKHKDSIVDAAKRIKGEEK